MRAEGHSTTSQGDPLRSAYDGRPVELDIHQQDRILTRLGQYPIARLRRLSGVKRPCRGDARMAKFDPEPPSWAPMFCNAHAPST